MKNSKIVKLLLILILSLFIVVPSVYAQKEYENTQGPKVVIVAENEENQLKVAKEIKNRLENTYYRVKMYRVKNMNKIKEEKYQHMIFVHREQNGNIPEGINRYLNRVQNRNKVMLVAVSQNGQWKPDTEDFEVFTCSQNRNNIQQTCDNITTRMRQRDKEMGMEKLQKRDRKKIHKDEDMEEQEQLRERAKDQLRDKSNQGGKQGKN